MCQPTQVTQATKVTQLSQPSKIVLEEIGLAEMSSDMPLKILHDKFDNAATRVGFVAMSNWNLDPAKMNRGFFTTRSMPTSADLLETMMEFVLLPD